MAKQTVSIRKCPKCMALIVRDVDRCPSCGTAVAAAPAPAELAPVASLQPSSSSPTEDWARPPCLLCGGTCDPVWAWRNSPTVRTMGWLLWGLAILSISGGLCLGLLFTKLFGAWAFLLAIYGIPGAFVFGVFAALMTAKKPVLRCDRCRATYPRAE